MKRQSLGGRGSRPVSGGGLDSLLNFLLSFGIAVVWLGRWTIRLAGNLWQRWSR
ncbi:hypothetical protein [Anaerovibrio sp.]|uniref:hypothetical protein n=1 Tax=Anaerovibrio sp. TaxID=1872532 RepID=UPI002629A6A4|nr:hypothetical protein [Anaerovibrio sp.]MDD6597435.1 hypothetical protein [Anaerovibrio sp.]